MDSFTGYAGVRRNVNHEKRPYKKVFDFKNIHLRVDCDEAIDTSKAYTDLATHTCAWIATANPLFNCADHGTENLLIPGHTSLHGRKCTEFCSLIVFCPINSKVNSPFRQIGTCPVPHFSARIVLLFYVYFLFAQIKKSRNC